MRYISLSTTLFLVALFIATAGCGSGSRPSTVPIKGKVTYGGTEWPAAGVLHLLPIEPVEGYPRRAARVEFGPDGVYSSPTSWEPGDGVVPGRYRVYVECWKIKPTIDGPAPVSYVQAKHLSGATSDIEVSVGVDDSGSEFNWNFPPNKG